MAWFHCQFCDLLRELSDKHIGKPAKCPKCKKRGTVVGARDTDLPTIGRVVDGGDEPQPSQPIEDGSIGSYLSGFTELQNAPSATGVVTFTAEGDIDDWQNDSSASSAIPPPQSQYEQGTAAPSPSKLQRLYKRAANWSSKDNPGRVFESYVTVGYLRWAWKLAIVVIGIVWLVGSLAIIFTFLSGSGLSTDESEGEQTARLSLVQYLFAWALSAGFKLVGLVIVLVLFTLISLLELFLARMSLETVAVFFDIAHDIRRLADTNANSEPTSNVA